MRKENKTKGTGVHSGFFLYHKYRVDTGGVKSYE